MKGDVKKKEKIPNREGQSTSGSCGHKMWMHFYRPLFSRIPMMKNISRSGL